MKNILNSGANAPKTNIDIYNGLKDKVEATYLNENDIIPIAIEVNNAYKADDRVALEYIVKNTVDPRRAMTKYAYAASKGFVPTITTNHRDVGLSEDKCNAYADDGYDIYLLASLNEEEQKCSDKAKATLLSIKANIAPEKEKDPQNFVKQSNKLTDMEVYCWLTANGYRILPVYNNGVLVGMECVCSDDDLASHNGTYQEFVNNADGSAHIDMTNVACLAANVDDMTKVEEVIVDGFKFVFDYSSASVRTVTGDELDHLEDSSGYTKDDMKCILTALAERYIESLPDPEDYDDDIDFCDDDDIDCCDDDDSCDHDCYNCLFYGCCDNDEDDDIL